MLQRCARVERRLWAPTEPNEGVLASAALALAEGWSGAAREFAEHCGNYERAQMERCGSSRAANYGLAYIDTRGKGQRVKSDRSVRISVLVVY